MSVKERKSPTSRQADPRPARTRAAIVDSARELASTGSALTMQTVAAGAAVSRSALYAQFANVDDLAVAVLSETFDEIGRVDSADRASRDADVGTIAERAAMRLVEHIHDRWDFYRSSLEWGVTSRAHDILVERFADTVKTSLAITHPAMPETDRHTLALFVGGGAMSLIRAWLRSEDPEQPSAIARALLWCMPPEVVGDAPQLSSTPARHHPQPREGTP